jgi:hypothetical protein
MAKQFALQADGSRTLKACLTHDLSFCITSDKESVNSRIDMSWYTEMVYGWCLSRIVHFIMALRLANPDTKIFLAKYNFLAAAQYILVLEDVANIALQLAFGGTPNVVLLFQDGDGLVQ